MNQALQGQLRRPGRLLLPEIYDPAPASGTSASAQHFANLSRYAVNQYGSAIYFTGALSQAEACAQNGQSTCNNTATANTPDQSYNQLYIEHSRASGRQRGGRRRRASVIAVTPVSAPALARSSESSVIRAWATDNGIAVNARGRIPAEVTAQYEAATS